MTEFVRGKTRVRDRTSLRVEESVAVSTFFFLATAAASNVIRFCRRQNRMDYRLALRLTLLAVRE